MGREIISLNQSLNEKAVPIREIKCLKKEIIWMFFSVS